MKRLIGAVGQLGVIFVSDMGVHYCHYLFQREERV